MELEFRPPDDLDTDPEPGSFEPEPGKCGARRKKGMGFCRKYPADGSTNGRCGIHNGLAAKGMANANFRHGGYAQYMPPPLIDRYEAINADPELLSYRDDLVLVQTRISELLERVRSGESGAAWKKLNKIWGDFEKYRSGGDVKQMQVTLELIAEPMRRGLADHAAWEELGTQIDRRGRLVDAERKRLDQLANTLSVDEAIGFIRMVGDVLERHIADAQILEAVREDLSGLAAAGTIPIVGRGRRRRS